MTKDKKLLISRKNLVQLSLRNKTKELSVHLESNEIYFGLCVEIWISNTSDDIFLLQQSCPHGLKYYSAPKLNKRGGGICIF